MGEAFLMEQPVDGPALQAAIRRATLALQFVPVFVGSAYKNKAGSHDTLLTCCCLSQLHQLAVCANVQLPCSWLHCDKLRRQLPAVAHCCRLPAGRQPAQH